MTKTSEIAIGIMKKYSEEAFLNHRKQVYSAIKAICFCTDFLQNQEDWGSRRAITYRSCDKDDYWKREFKRGYDSGLRREEFEKLREVLNAPGPWTAEEIPFKNFLNQGILLMMEDTWKMEIWMELMEAKIITDQYTDYRAVQEAVYVLGLFELMKFQNGISCHYFNGDFREAERLLKEIRNWIPTEEQENYDSYGTKLLQEMEQRRIDTMKHVLKERDERLEKVRDGIPVFKRFCRKMKEMGDEEFGEFIRNEISRCEESFEEEVKWDSQMKLKAKVVSRVRKLAELFIYGGSILKERLFQNLSKEEQIAVMELWMAGFYPFDEKELANRIEGMTEAMDPEYPFSCYEEKYMALSRKNMRDSLQAIMGDGIVERWRYRMWM